MAPPKTKPFILSETDRSVLAVPQSFFEALDAKLEAAQNARAAGSHPLWLRPRAERMKACEHDLFLFAEVYLPHRMSAKSPPFHKELLDMAEQGEQEHRGVVIAAPRGHAKSSILSFLLPLHRALYGQKHFIIIISNTFQLASLLIGDIRHELETNPGIRADFGSLAGHKWSGPTIVTKSGVRIVAKGTASQIRGLRHGEYRPDLVIGDDLENDEHVQNEEQRKKTWDWWNRAVMPTLDPKTGSFIVVGTVIHFDSLLIKLLKLGEATPDLPEPPYITARYQTPQEDGTPLWPDLYSLEWLAKKKKEMGSFAYNSEYMNMPIDEESQIFKPTWWRWYTKTDVYYDHLNGCWMFEGMPLTIYQGVDPAIGTTKFADWFAHVTIGVTPKKQILVLWAIREKIDFPTQIKLITEQYFAWRPKTIGIEESVYQRALKQQLLHDGRIPEQAIKGLRVQAGGDDDPHIEPQIRRITRGLRRLASTKQLRLISRSLLVEQGQVYLRAAMENEEGEDRPELPRRRIHKQFVPFFIEATQYPRSSNDDIIDAWDDAMQCATGIARWGAEWYGDLNE